METIRIAEQQSQVGMVAVRFFQWARHLLRHVRIQRRERSLRVCESLALGEKRSILVLEFESKRYLLGTTSQSICLLDRLSGFDGGAASTHLAPSFPERTFVSTLKQ
jgi:flagellar biogenesis protein FliO